MITELEIFLILVYWYSNSNNLKLDLIISLKEDKFVRIIELDKLTNRYGGKGVVSYVKPDFLMPKTSDGRTVDIQANICGVYGRENAGQLFEMSLNYTSNNIAKAMNEDTNTTADCVKLYLDYLELVSPSMHAEMSRFLSLLTDDEISEFISSITEDEMLYLDIDPVSETMTIDKLAEIYRRFPWIEQEYVLVPMQDSNGNFKYVKSRRPVVCGHVYYYRLKQYGKEKFSVTSLSATNIKNENSRNKSSKVYKARHSRTPIRFGDMELGNFGHMGADLSVQILMLYAASPEGRMLAESMMTSDPFHIDVRLNDTASNRNVEILNTYLKTIGVKLDFGKIPKKKIYPIHHNPIRFIPNPGLFPTNPIKIFGPDVKLHENHIRRLHKGTLYPLKINPIKLLKSPEEVMKRIEEVEAELRSGE